MHRDADEAVARLAAANHGVFGIDDARNAGLSARQIDRRVGGRWHLIHEGVYRVAGAPVTWRGELRAALLAAGDGAAISHRAAAALYQLPGGRAGAIELTCPRWTRTRRPEIVVHERRRVDERDTHVVDGLTVTRPELLLLDLAWLHPTERFLEILVQAARRRRLITYASARETFDRHARRGLRGVAVLREVFDLWDPTQRATESEMETALRALLRELGLPQPVTQFVVTDQYGRFVARTDLGWPEQRVTLEYDSKQEHSDEFQLQEDARRRNAIIAAGYLPLTARHRDVMNGAANVAEMLDRVLTDRTGVTRPTISVVK